ncbi:cytosine permease [Kitasatospora mediocidica]|uniref:cytosine permease n=1 Tax=Kitasatospora mediocidica TaxID=58352 RepID=UPI00068E1BAE|nr:cytosine permease [Kitasatospora mediocidica]
MTTAPARGDDGTSVSAPADPNALITAYGSHVLAVEPTGAEPVPESARHGSALGLLWTWLSPNMEFATVYIGVISVLFFGLGFWTATAALLLGTAVGSATHGWLSVYGPRFDVPQMVVGRLAFGRRGNALPAALNAAGAGLGWFAVNSVSGAFALATLSGMPTLLCLVLVVIAQITVAYLGHNFVHGFERYALPPLTVVFLAASAVTLGKAHLSGAASTTGTTGGFLLAFSTAFGYAAGWNPFAADYTRYLPAATARWKVALYPAVGVFVGVSLLAVVGAASATIATGEQNPTGRPRAARPTNGWPACVFALDYGLVTGVTSAGGGRLLPLGGLGPIADSAVQLGRFVDLVRGATGAAKVDIVGHSQGGMLPNYYLKFLGGAGRAGVDNEVVQEHCPLSLAGHVAVAFAPTALHLVTNALDPARATPVICG